MTTMLAIEARRRTPRQRSRYAWVDAIVTSSVIAGFALALGVMVAESLGERPDPAAYATAAQRAG